LLLITKRAKSLITFENIIKNIKVLKVFKKKEYISRIAQNCIKREFNNRLIKDLKRIAKKDKKNLIKELNKNLLVI